MHRLAVLAFIAVLAGCLGAETRPCANGATCPYDQACTNVPVTEGAQLCGTPRLVDACDAKGELATCDFTNPGADDGTCRSGVCSACSFEIAGCRYRGWNPMTSNTTQRLRAVWAATPSEAFAVGEQRTFLYYDGLAWRASKIEGTSIGDAAALTGVYGTTSAVYVTSSDGKIVRGALIGGAFTWTEVASATQLLGIAGSSATDIVAVGLDGTSGVVLAFDGTAWTKTTVPGSSVILRAVWVDGAGAWAVGNQGAIVRRDAGVWSTSQAATVGQKPLNGVWGTAGDAYAASDAPTSSDPLILRYQGATWAPVGGLEPFSGFNLSSVWSDGAVVYATGQQGTLLRFDGATWTIQSVATMLDLEAVRGTGADNVLVVGAGGTVFRFTGVD